MSDKSAEMKRYRARYPDKKRADNAAWRAANPDYKTITAAIRVSVYNATYWLRHPGLRQSLKAAYRARHRNSIGSFTSQEWRDKCALLGNVCIYCGEAKPLTVDHNVPLSRGGTNSIDNILPSCASCNSRKRDKTAREFLALTA